MKQDSTYYKPQLNRQRKRTVRETITKSSQYVENEAPNPTKRSNNEPQLWG